MRWQQEHENGLRLKIRAILIIRYNSMLSSSRHTSADLSHKPRIEWLTLHRLSRDTINKAASFHHFPRDEAANVSRKSNIV